MTVPQFALILLAAFGPAAGIAYYFANLSEDGFNDEAKKKLARRLKQFRLAPNTRVAFEAFLFASDRFYGRGILSLRAMARSAAFTIGWFCLLLAVCASQFPNYRSWLSTPGVGNLIWKFSAVFLAVGILIDFVSTAVTRALIRWTLRSPKVPSIVVASVDFVFSGLWFYLIFSATKAVVLHGPWPSIKGSLLTWFHLAELPIGLMTLNDLTEDMLQRQADGTISIVGGWNTEIVYAFPEGVLFLSSLLTSIWLWLYIAAYWSHLVALRFDATKTKLLSISNIEAKPFKSIAILSLVFIYPATVAFLVCMFAIYRALA